MITVLLAAVIANVFLVVDTGYGFEISGCYPKDALFFGFACREFPGATLLTIWLNWPLFLVQGPLFLVLNPGAFFLFFLSWSPILFLIVFSVREKYCGRA